LIGLHSADATSLDVVRAYGGGSWAMLTKVRIRASLPSLFAGLRIAAPASVLGAIIGEYLGGQSGLGVAMINSEQALDIPRTWGIALAITAIGGVGYAVTALAARLLTPWAPAGRR
jgi:ABC-type nitrate/sulfonate/bicarbonate transport system permease component